MESAIKELALRLASNCTADVKRKINRLVRLVLYYLCGSLTPVCGCNVSRYVQSKQRTHSFHQLVYYGFA